MSPDGSLAAWKIHDSAHDRYRHPWGRVYAIVRYLALQLLRNRGKYCLIVNNTVFAYHTSIVRSNS